MTREAPHRTPLIDTRVATSATRIPPAHRRGGLIIFDYGDPTGQWFNPESSPFSDTERLTFQVVPAAQRMTLATESARAASSRIRAGGTALFAAARDAISATDESDSLCRLVSTAIMGVADTPGYTLILAPGRWRRYLPPCGLASDMPMSKVSGSSDLWHPAFDSGLHGVSPIVWRGASETETIADVRDLLTRALRSEVSPA